MALDWLTDPVSEDEPCGPDLEATDDEKFLDYYYEAESRLPERYFVPGMADSKDEFVVGTLFDKASIDLKAERKEIEALLQRSRDLRLLSLLARFAILADNLDLFADGLEGIADLMETHPADVNPKDNQDRRSTLDDLSNGTAVLIPLQYAELAGSGGVSVRRHTVAKGEADAREGEVGLNAGAIVGELNVPSSKKAVEAAHAALDRAASALDRIRRACLAADNPFSPAIGPTTDAVREAQELIALGRPDLQPWSADGAAGDDAADGDVEADDEDAEAADGDAPAAAAGPKTVAAAPIVVTALPNRAAAVQAITALETYFATHEPASPALLLVTQARLLVGRPLVEAIRTLLPRYADDAKIDFGPTTGFVLDFDRLAFLAEEGVTMAGYPEDDEPGEPPVVSNRNEASANLSAVEEFFRAREPASPIPVLLLRARTYLDKDFSAIVAELIPPPPAD